MSKSFYILLIANLVLVGLLKTDLGLLNHHIVYFSFILIAFIGIPHGAIDHILYLTNSTLRPSLFYISYLLLVLIFILLWKSLPILSFGLFLVVSAYHFGQSQLSRYVKSGLKHKRIVSMSWGLVVLCSFILINLNEILISLQEYSDMQRFEMLFNSTLFYSILFVSLGILAYYLFLNRRIVKIGYEVTYLGLIILTFLLHPLLLGFALFFVISHSYEVMHVEFSFLRKSNSKLKLTKFIKLLLPLTFISLLGIFLVYLLSVYEIIEISLPFLLLIVVSSLTIPHSFVMESFYKKI
jgi:beta-carotene 15,15'-dioxygenase